VLFDSFFSFSKEPHDALVSDHFGPSAFNKFAFGFGLFQLRRQAVTKQHRPNVFFSVTMYFLLN